jgi:hypothetical protein
MAFNGTGSNVTSLNASNVSSGTLAVARGGTGTASPSLVGGTNITISGTWPNQTVTAAGGGVTSLNGQTGAITNTDFGAIGSYVFGYISLANGSVVTAGTTFAGSSLSRSVRDDLGSNFNLMAFGGGAQYLAGFGFDTASMGLSGTWRSMGRIRNGAGEAGQIAGFWVRIS